jgi:ElaB/YqjD/DUF883 family membrane-anchored ribosome-binding protein
MIMKSTNDISTQSPRDVLDELRALVVEAEKMIGDSISDNSAEAVGALRARYEAIQERMSDLVADAKRKAISGAKYTDEAIRTYPYQSLAIALGTGLIVGLLLGRRGR